MTETEKLGFLGYGNMGSAILDALIQRSVIRVSQARVYDPSAERRKAAEQVGIALAPSAAALAAECDTVILAVKPQIMAEAVKELKAELKEDALVISVAAGLSTAFLERQLGGAVRVIRVMPNTPSLVHAGAAAIARGAQATDRDLQLAQAIFEAVGLAVVVDESKMDAVTALSGSGPAYLFRMVECMMAAAVEEGLDEATARRLATQTLYGAGWLLHNTGDSPGDLRRNVTSPGGTTEAALNQLEADRFPEVIRRAIHAAAERSRELGS